MGKRNTTWDSKKIEQWIKEGRGQGEGKEYKPWLTIQDFPSMGRVTKVMVVKVVKTFFCRYIRWILNPPFLNNNSI